jgi:mannose-6-phosphate isomerase-like protein (cupin superfamily)
VPFHLAVLGLGISLLWATISKQFKIGEHCKQLVRTWWYWEKPEQIPFRVPVPLLQQATLPSSGATTKQLAFLQRNGHGLIREVVSPASASTYNLRVVTLVIGPGRELSPSRSNGVEFYYVLTGSGVVSQQGIAATSQIRAGDCFIVDVGQMRWIANPDAVTEDLVLLRASDGLSSGCGIGRHDIIRLDPNRRATTTIDAIKDSVRHMHSLARDYVNGVAE